MGADVSRTKDRRYIRAGRWLTLRRYMIEFCGADPKKLTRAILDEQWRQLEELQSTSSWQFLTGGGKRRLRRRVHIVALKKAAPHLFEDPEHEAAVALAEYDQIAEVMTEMRREIGVVKQVATEAAKHAGSVGSRCRKRYDEFLEFQKNLKKLYEETFRAVL